MTTCLVLAVALLLSTAVLQSSASPISHRIYRKMDTELTLPGGVKPEQISVTDQQHLDLFNYVVQLTAQLNAKSSVYGVITPLQWNSTYVKLKAATLLAEGFTYNEFKIPPGATLSPPVEEVILVYNKFPKDSNPFTSMSGDIVSSVVDLACYALPGNGSAITVTPPAPEVIAVTFTSDQLASEDPSSDCRSSTPGTSGVTKVPVSTRAGGVECAAPALGSYFVLVPPAAPPSPPASFVPESSPPVASPPPPASSVPGAKTTTTKSNDSTPVVVGATLGVIAALALLAILLLWGYRFWHRKKIAKMEQESERGETLQTALMFGGSRAPAAGAMRTKPRLEDASVMEDAFLNKAGGR